MFELDVIELDSTEVLEEPAQDQEDPAEDQEDPTEDQEDE